MLAEELRGRSAGSRLLKCSGCKAALLKQRAECLLQVACLQWLQLRA